MDRESRRSKLPPKGVDPEAGRIKVPTGLQVSADNLADSILNGIESMDIAMIRIDTDYRVLAFNRRAREIYGDVPLNDFCYHITVGLDDICANCPAKLVFGGKAIGFSEHRHTTTAGEEINIHQIAIPVKNTTGNITGALLFIIDITERKQVEEALRITQFSFDRAAVGIYRIASDARILEVNDKAASMIGYTKKELVSMSIPDIDPQITKDDWDAVWQRLATQGGLDTFETLHRRKDGSIMPVEIHSNLLDYENLRYSIAFVQDITEKKRIMDALIKRGKELDEKARYLGEANAALKSSLDHREAEKRSVEETLVKDLKKYISPYVDALSKCKLDVDASAYLKIVKTHLNDLISRHSRTILSQYADLTPTEVRVADLIRDGKDTNEIAQLLYLAPTSVHWHRKNIRRKLGIKDKKVNLFRYLNSFE